MNRPEALTPQQQLGFTFEEPKSVRRIWPVRELVSHVCGQVEREYSDVWVEGEISNCRPAPSGHLYFTLKDADAQLPVVLFRRQALLLRFKPADGQHVLVRGRVSVYPQRGQLQLVGETVEPVGAGSLQLAFEQLREKLKAEGLFDSARKRPLPAFPRSVGIVTSPTGAVIRDFLNIVGRRHAGLNVVLCPAAVQGEQAIAEVELAIAHLNASGLVDVIVVARGGGSAEDLAAFNSERIARAIAASGLPVVSAVGHETDFTIADFVADLRAPTPSAAAELITEAQHRVAERVANQASRLERAARFQVLHARQKLDRVAVERAERKVSGNLRRVSQRLDDLEFRLDGAMNGGIRMHQRAVAELAADVLHHEPRQLLARARERLGVSDTRIERSVERTVRRASARVDALNARLRSLSPLAVLERGYALVMNEDGAVIRSLSQVSEQDKLRTRLSDGEFVSTVEEVRESSSGTK
ncbi:exodeoxyribonuclease VII large subunit [Occallatibacter savannae]|uniref:exodeoxyribonuclease VII large subunit n=1 Tax=Occallatibacter savannae TaxID=1002691 RepID=UPI001EF47E0C|nr:exodeoxyribonuclease VII large subunit [Occallatibacter savannae]